MQGFTDRRGVPEPDRKRPVTVVVELIDDRRKLAMLVADPADRRVTAWLPRSEIRVDFVASGKLRITMPAWLAEEKGLIALAGEGQGVLF